MQMGAPDYVPTPLEGATSPLKLVGKASKKAPTNGKARQAKTVKEPVKDQEGATRPVSLKEVYQ